MNPKPRMSYRSILAALLLFAAVVAFCLACVQSVAAQDIESTPFLIEGSVPDSGDDTIIVPVPMPDTSAPAVVVVQPAESPQSDEIPQAFMWGFIVVVIALLAAFVLFLRPILLEAAKKASPVVREAVFAGGDSLIVNGEVYVKRTPTPIDDTLLAELRREFEEFKREVRAGTTPGAPTP